MLEGRPHVVDNILSGHVDLVINTTNGAQAIADEQLASTALTHNIPYYTTVEGARAAVQAMKAMRAGRLEVAPLQSYLRDRFNGGGERAPPVTLSEEQVAVKIVI